MFHIHVSFGGSPSLCFLGGSRGGDMNCKFEARQSYKGTFYQGERRGGEECKGNELRSLLIFWNEGGILPFKLLLALW